MMIPFIMFCTFLFAIPNTTYAGKTNKQIKDELNTLKTSYEQLQKTLQETQNELDREKEQAQVLTEKNEDLQNIAKNVDKYTQQAEQYKNDVQEQCTKYKQDIDAQWNEDKQKIKKIVEHRKKRQRRIAKRQDKARHEQFEWLQEKKSNLHEKEASLKTKERELEETLANLEATFANAQAFSKTTIHEEKQRRAKLRKEITKKNNIINQTMRTLNNNMHELNTINATAQTTHQTLQQTNEALALVQHGLQEQEQLYADTCALKDQILAYAILEKDIEIGTIKNTALTTQNNNLLHEKNTLETNLNNLRTRPLDQITCLCTPFLQSGTWWRLNHPLSAGTFAAIAHLFTHTHCNDTESNAYKIVRTMRDSCAAAGLCCMLTSNYTKYNGLLYACAFAFLDLSSRVLYQYMPAHQHIPVTDDDSLAKDVVSAPDEQRAPETISTDDNITPQIAQPQEQPRKEPLFAQRVRTVAAWVAKMILTHVLLEHTLFKS